MDITVREVMTFVVETISPAATLEHAAKKMNEQNVGILPVVEEERILGVVTDRDIVLRAVSERMRPEMTRVRDVMTRAAICCYEDQSITEAAGLMETHLVHRLIVLHRNQKLAGIVSLSDLAAKAKSDLLSGHVLAQVSAA
jgi:CBS domain-containing protein